MLKRDNWTNDEVIKILEGRKIFIGNKERSDKQLHYLQSYNDGIEQAIVQFCDFKADPKDSYSAMAYDTELERIFIVSPPMPQ